MQQGRIAELEAIVTRLAQRAREDDPDPFVLRLLVRRYRATGDEHLFDVLGVALARGTEWCRGAAPGEDRADWLHALADATVISDDEIVLACARELLAALRSVATPACIEASLRGAVATHAADAVAPLVDNLERLIGGAYEPGEGVMLNRGRGSLPSDQTATASALLTAYQITGRLPYAMLAEELVQTMLSSGWREDEVRATSHAATVLCGLAALHCDEAYRTAAVTARGADYRSDAGRLIARHERQALDHPRDAAAFGLALADWLELQ